MERDIIKYDDFRRKKAIGKHSQYFLLSDIIVKATGAGNNKKKILNQSYD